jgi:hypothetical protein
LYLWANRATPAVYFDAHGSGIGSLVPGIEAQSWVSAPGDGFLGPNLVPSARLNRGQWFHIEVVLVGNTSGARDGSLDWYLDGVHVGSYTGVQFTSGAAQWTQMNLAPVWGGVDGTVPATQTLDVDHFYMSGKQ